MPRGPVRTDEQLKADLAKVIAEHGGSSISVSEYSQVAKSRCLASVATYRAKFGSWENAVRAALMTTQSSSPAKPPEPPLAQELAPRPNPEQRPAPKPAPMPKPQTPTRAISWKETPREERLQKLEQQRAEAEVNGTSREIKLINLFGTRVIFGREVTSSRTQFIEPDGEARICGVEQRAIRDGVDNANGLQSLVGGTLLYRRDVTAKVLRAGQLEDFPPERPRTFYLVPEPVALALLPTGRKDLVYPSSYGSGDSGTIICRAIVIP